MKRRDAIKQLFVLAGGMMIATSCDFNPGKASIELTHLDLTAKDEALLAKLVEAIIPKTDSPGGEELNLHLFVMKMVDDCTSPDEQKAFVQGLKDAKNLRDADSEAILDYLRELSADDVFGRILKSRTTQGYLNSEYVMTNKLIYELVPGRYDGAVKIER